MPQRGKGIPAAVQARTEQRILAHAAKHHAGKFTRIDVRFRGALCYIDGYTEPDSAVHLCRLRYFGNEHHWGFAYYKYSSEKYEPSFLLSGKDQARRRRPSTRQRSFGNVRRAL